MSIITSYLYSTLKICLKKLKPNFFLYLFCKQLHILGFIFTIILIVHIKIFDKDGYILKFFFFPNEKVLKVAYLEFNSAITVK